MIYAIRKVQSTFSLFTLIVFLNFLFGCSYYKVGSKSVTPGPATKVIADNGKTNFYVLHVGESLWQINNVKISDDEITGSLVKLDSMAMHYYQKYQYNDRVKSVDRRYVHQVHVHADKFSKRGDIVAVAGKDVTGVDVYDMNTGKTVASYLGTTILLGLGTIIVTLLIACACPHVYLYDGETYHLDNNLFTGATSPVLERDDHQLMPDYFKDSDSYELLVINEENERQLTNQMELIVAYHGEDTRIVPDQEGNLHTISNAMKAKRIVDDNDEDIVGLAGIEDDQGHLFNTESKEGFSNVYATFTKPADAKNAKLVLKVKNNPWGGYVYNEFSKLFGRQYDNWVKRNHKKSKEEVMASLKGAGIPLLVSMRQGNEWKDIELVDLVGESSYNTLAIPIGRDLMDGENLEFRIRSGFMFWNLDYVGMDFSGEKEMDVQYLSVSEAVGNGKMDFREDLSFDDDRYMEHVRGDTTKVTFRGLKTDSESRTIILHSKGYYLPTKEYEGKPARKELAKFRSDGHFSRYSKALHDKVFEGFTFNSQE